ncbi:ABC transporter substrate-binding protein [Demequina sp. B12]|uniref:siderophore ABC transporter substrate-binding protein n=1 Tax=Demequina sp. B12 TaxID=2992757 RepID=UPI00237C2FB3|nr:ABC transporter substrate-binding protein [Demequina sp. B12]MDE0571866.1 ABC transporter substrate-binding protein [Demequina sp. B12]
MSAVKNLRVPALLAATAVALTACATDSTDEAGASDATTAEPTTTAVAEAAEAPTEVTVQTAQGEVTVPVNPENVVVFEHGILDTIQALGASDNVAGIPHHALPEYLATDFETSTENTGTLFEPDYEAINALEPDLIIVGGRSAATIEDMSAIAPTIDLSFGWGSAPFQESFVRNTTSLGQIFDAEDEAQAAIADVTAKVEATAAVAAEAGPGLVVMTSGGELSAYGPSEEGRYDFVYNLLGVVPAAEQVAIDTHGDAISFEYLAELDPSLLIVLDRDAAIGTEGAESAQAVLDNDLVNGTTAVSNGDVVYADTAKWYLSFGGLTSVNSIVDEVSSLVG